MYETTEGRGNSIRDTSSETEKGDSKDEGETRAQEMRERGKLRNRDIPG